MFYLLGILFLSFIRVASADYVVLSKEPVCSTYEVIYNNTLTNEVSVVNLCNDIPPMANGKIPSKDIEENKMYSLNSWLHSYNWNLDYLDGVKDLHYQEDYNGYGTNIYIVDTGLANYYRFYKIQKGYSSISPSWNLNDCVGHGTHVSSIAGSKFFGVAKKATIIPVKVFECKPYTTMYNVVRGLLWIKHHLLPRSVINLSLGGSPSPMLDAALVDLHNKGAVIVVAAGNDGGEYACEFSPSRVPIAISVGSYGKNKKVAYYSNKGPCVAIYAPGSNIAGWSNVGSKYVFKTGTSMASPHVAGVAALVRQEFPDYNSSQVRDVIIQRSVKNFLEDPRFLSLKSVNETILPKKYDCSDKTQCFNNCVINRGRCKERLYCNEYSFVKCPLTSCRLFMSKWRGVYCGDDY